MLKKSILPNKLLTIIHSAVCVAIMLAIVIMSFGTIFTAKIEPNGDIQETFDSVVNSLGDGETVVMPTEIEISMPFLIKSVSSLGEIVSSAMKTFNDVTEAKDNLDQATENIESDPLNADEAVDDINENLDTIENSTNAFAESLHNENFVGLVSLIVFIVSAFGESFILGIVYFAMIVFVVTLPIVASINFVIATISLFVNIVNVGRGHSTVSKTYGNVFAMFPMLWIMKIIAPNVTFAPAVTGMIVLMIIGFVLGIVMSRLKAYGGVQFRYINVIQGVSVASLVGYFLFMIGLEKMGLFDRIWRTLGGSASFSSLVLPALLVVMLIVFLMIACKHVRKIACRLSVMMKVSKAKENKPLGFAKDSYTASAVIPLIAALIIVALMSLDIKLDLGDGEGMFIMFCVGVGIMLASEITMKVLKKTVCHGITPEDVNAVLSGCPDAITEETAEEIVEEATEETAEEVVEEATEETAEEVVEEATEETAEEVVEEATEEIAKEMADN